MSDGDLHSWPAAKLDDHSNPFVSAGLAERDPQLKLATQQEEEARQEERRRRRERKAKAVEGANANEN